MALLTFLTKVKHIFRGGATVPALSYKEPFWNSTLKTLLLGQSSGVPFPVSPVYVVDAGSSNAISITLPFTPLAWTDLVGIPILIKVKAANTGATTLAVTGLTGTKSVKKSVSTALDANDLLANGIYEIISYDGTTFQLTVGLKGAKGDAGAKGDTGSPTITTINDQTSNRSFGVIYQNSSLNNMFLTLTISMDASLGDAGINIFIGATNTPGLLIGQNLCLSGLTTSIFSPTTIIIPPSYYYNIVDSSDGGTIAILKWIEMY